MPTHNLSQVVGPERMMRGAHMIDFTPTGWRTQLEEPDEFSSVVITEARLFTINKLAQGEAFAAPYPFSINEQVYVDLWLNTCQREVADLNEVVCAMTEGGHNA